MLTVYRLHSVSGKYLTLDRMKIKLTAKKKKNTFDLSLYIRYKTATHTINLYLLLGKHSNF